MLPQPGGGAIQGQLGTGKPHRAAHARQTFGRDLHFARNDLRVGKDLGHVIDRPGGNARTLAGGKQIGLGPGTGCLGQAKGQRRAVRHAVGIGQEFWR